jgi:hypothetical protein
MSLFIATVVPRLVLLRLRAGFGFLAVRDVRLCFFISVYVPSIADSVYAHDPSF